jgi:hypothetical protein
LLMLGDDMEHFYIPLLFIVAALILGELIRFIIGKTKKQSV